MLQRLCEKYGDDLENVIKSIMHSEFNNGRNRYKDLTVSEDFYSDSILIDHDWSIFCFFL